MTIMIGATAKAAYMKPCAAATATPEYANQRILSHFTDVTLYRSEGDSKIIVATAVLDAPYEISEGRKIETRVGFSLAAVSSISVFSVGQVLGG
jgi:hypothetical protein